ncbi:hypothetical protein GJ496_008386 [Pomphorhynchus laevis]|nr:hypothetical protein GJ496_008386 [Pomphorhynchus laevis]
MKEIIDALQNTLDYKNQAEADKWLRQFSRKCGFPTSLLQICISDTIELPIREAAVIYLKHVIRRGWQRNSEGMNESDRIYIQANILPALSCANYRISGQLVDCLRFIIPEEFPDNWLEMHNTVKQYIESDRADMILSGLMVLHQLVKHFEYKSKDNRVRFLEYYTPLLPGLLERLNMLVDDTSNFALRIKHMILKGFSRFIRMSFPLDCFTLDSLDRLITSLCQMIKQNPEEAFGESDEVNIDVKANHPVWRCCKWSSRILNRIMEKYGSPKSVSKEYLEFSNYFLKGFSDQIISVCLVVFNRYANREYVLDTVMYELLIYLSKAVTYAFCWNLSQHHIPFIIEKVIFPQLCITDDDEELFENEPLDFMSVKHDLYGDFESSVYASQTFLNSVCSKREFALNHTMNLCQRLITDFHTLDYKQKDGLFHMMGIICHTLKKKPAYKTKLEQFLIQVVEPEVKSTNGCLRFRALWTLEMYRYLKLSPEAVVIFVNCAYDRMMNDESDVVKVQAAAVLVKYSLKYKTQVKPVLIQNTRVLVLKMLDLIQKIEYDEVPRLFKDLLFLIEDEIPPIAVEITVNLVKTFVHMLSHNEEEQDFSISFGECKSLAAAEILQVLSKITACVDPNSEMFTKLEEIVIEVIKFILSEGFVDFYSEMSDLTFYLTKDHISSSMWDVLPLIKVFLFDFGYDYFLDMTPTIFNFICVNSVEFFERNMEQVVLQILIEVLQKSDCDQSLRYAAKLLEVVVAQSILTSHHSFYSDLIQFCLNEIFKLQSEDSPDHCNLQTLYILCILCSLYIDWKCCVEVLSLLNKLSEFLNVWLCDIDRFASLHNRLICVLALSKLLQLCSTQQQFSANLSAPIMAKCTLAAVQLLKRSYHRKQLVQDSDNDSCGDSDYVGDMSDSSSECIPDQDDDVLTSSNFNYLSENQDENSDPSGEVIQQRRLDSYLTVFDENDEINPFSVLNIAFRELKDQKPDYYQEFMQSLSTTGRHTLENIIADINQQ